jgi:transcription elongation factor GreA
MTDREQLEREIDRLKYELSVTIPQEMQEAAELGDLKESTEFSEILTRQQFANIRLHQLIQRLAAYKQINLNHISRDKVGIGSIITVHHNESDNIKIFKVMSVEISNEESPSYTEITINSPIGKALYNKSVGDIVMVPLPSKKAIYKILNILTIHDIENGT